MDFSIGLILESAKHMTEMSTWNLPGDKGLSARKAENFTAFCKRIV
jgi:hypothetical protein